MVESKYRGTQTYVLAQAEMITAAKYRGTVTYEEMAKLLGWPLSGQWMGTEIGRLITEITEDEVAQKRPMLAAVVVTTEGFPGPGFFNLARQLGLLKSEEKQDERLFWERECKRVYEEWKVILPAK